MQRYTLTLTIGHNVKDTPTFDTQEICDQVTEYLGAQAFTAFECAGMWQGMKEASTRVEIAALTQAELNAIVDEIPYLAAALAQDSIMCEIRPDAVQFIGAKTFDAQQTL